MADRTRTSNLHSSNGTGRSAVLSSSLRELGETDVFGGPPTITSARRIGWRPGTPFVHTFSAIGQRPRVISVEGLPASISVDSESGVASGIMPAEAETIALKMTVENDQGTAEAPIELCLGDTLALTPPMGWNSWNQYAHDVDERVILGMADAMVATGMRDLGYSFINIDDFWHADTRAPGGEPRAHPEKFPRGIAPVAAYLHERGIKLGIYSDAAERTCGGRFGGLGYERIDAQAYASWGVDLLKYDYCHAPRSEAVAALRYGAMSSELQACERSIVFSVCEWGLRKPWNWAPRLGAAYWRTTPDIFDTFHAPVFGVRAIAKKNLTLGDFAHPGKWNDPDMLLVGNRGTGLSTSNLPLTFGKLADIGPRPRVSLKGITEAQSHTHMTLWTIMASPLLTSNDLNNMVPFDKNLLCNPEVLAINQDELGQQGRRFGREERDVWRISKPLVGGRTAIAVVNMGNKRAAATTMVGEAGLHGVCQIRDVWAQQDRPDATELRVELGPYESALWVVKPTNPT